MLQYIIMLLSAGKVSVVADLGRSDVLDCDAPQIRKESGAFKISCGGIQWTEAYEEKVHAVHGGFGESNPLETHLK